MTEEDRELSPLAQKIALPGCMAGMLFLIFFPILGILSTPGVWNDLDQILQALLVTLALGVPVVLLVLIANRRAALLRLIAWLSRWLPGRKRLRTSPQQESSSFPFAWEQILRRNVPFYSRLAPSEQVQLQRLILDFLQGKNWVGCNGLEITDEIRLTIAAQACVLLLGSIDHDAFSSVVSILVYPSTFGSRHHDHGIDSRVATLGEAWYRGPVILAWDEVLAGGRDPDDGHNVVYHEFAHQLDFAGESLEQAADPALIEQRRLRHEVLHAEYQSLVQATQQGRATLLDHYGATNPQEFFAVATECFFEMPLQMQQAHPQLYDVLVTFYGQDPGQRLLRYRSLAESAARRDRLPPTRGT